jgi:hypothetical protein
VGRRDKKGVRKGGGGVVRRVDEGDLKYFGLQLEEEEEEEKDRGGGGGESEERGKEERERRL